MKNKTAMLMIALAAALAFLAARVVTLIREASRPATIAVVSPKPQPARVSAPTVTLTPEPGQNVSSASGIPPNQPEKSAAENQAQRQPAVNLPDWSTVDPGTKEQLGRVALSYVGADPEADMAWMWVINDATLPGEARRNLIEDLNEDGLSDPRRPTMEDLPLIVSRLQLIEEVGPYAMDQVNLEAFQEAYKDLVNMYTRLTGQ